MLRPSCMPRMCVALHSLVCALACSSSATVDATHVAPLQAQVRAKTFLAGGIYKLVNPQSGLCLDLPAGNPASGVGVQTWPCNGFDPQRYRVMPVGGGYNLVTLGPQKCLGVVGGNPADGARLEQRECHGGAEQVFGLQNVHDSVFALTLPFSNKCVDIAGDATAQGTPVQQWDCNGVGGQQWTLLESTFDDGGVYNLQNAGSGKCADIAGDGATTGANLTQVACNNAAEQGYRFLFAGVDNNGHGYYSIVGNDYGQCVEVVDARRDPGAKVWQWSCLGATAWHQQWEPVSDNAGRTVFLSRLSQQAIDVVNGSTDDGAEYNLWPQNGAASQSWFLVHSQVAPSPPWRLSGRFFPGAGNLLAPQTVSWSYSSIVAAFSGPAIAVQVQGAEFAVVLDNQPAQFISAPQTWGQLDPAAAHTITVTKRVEPQYGTAVFSGLALPSGGRFLPPPAAANRRIEFIGDSITNGYGNLGTSAYCNADWSNEDTTQAFGPLTAAALQAEAHVTAWAGMGLFRDWSGNPAYTLPNYWRHWVAGDPGSVWDFSAWVPHVVVINLGTNDFSSGIPDAGTFQNAYLQYIAEIRAHYGAQAQIVCALSPMLYNGARDAARDDILAVVNQAHAQGDGNVRFVEFAPLNVDPASGAGAGCGFHPNLQAHQDMSRVLTPVIQGIMGW